MSPDSARHILLDTQDQAVEEARKKVAEDGRPRYVCMVIFKVEAMPPPVLITRAEEV